MTTSLNPFTWREFKQQWDEGQFVLSNLGESFCSRFGIDDARIRRLYQNKRGWELLLGWVMNNMPLGENLPDKEED